MAENFAADSDGSREFLRHQITQVERGVFDDETAAARVEKLATQSELWAYLQVSWSRYETAAAEPYAATGYDAQSRAFLADSNYADLVQNMAKFYHDRRSQELHALEREYSDAVYALGQNERMLAEDSRDDPESRRLLTDLKEAELAHEPLTQQGFEPSKTLHP